MATANLHINGFYEKMLKGVRATPSLILFSRVQRSWNCNNILCGHECTHHPKSGVWRPDYKAQYGRFVRWALVLQQYQFTVKAIKGSENVGADFLSRHSVTPDIW